MAQKEKKKREKKDDKECNRAKRRLGTRMRVHEGTEGYDREGARNEAPAKV
jgi:hypothetical protein